MGQEQVPEVGKEGTPEELQQDKLESQQNAASNSNVAAATPAQQATIAQTTADSKAAAAGAAPKIDYTALAAKYGGTPAPPEVDYTALAAKYGGSPASPATQQKSAPEQSHDLLTRALVGSPQGYGPLRVQGAREVQAKNISDHIYNDILGKDTYEHSNLKYDAQPSNAWEWVKNHFWSPIGQDTYNKMPGTEPDRVAMLQEQGQDTLAAGNPLLGIPGLGKENADYLREHILHGFTPEVMARGAAKSVTDFFSPGYYALGAFGRVAQGYQKAGQLATAAGDTTKAATAFGKARLLGLFGSSGMNVPFAASQAHDLVENWDKMSVPERVAASSGIIAAMLNVHIGMDAAGGYKKVGGEALDATQRATSVVTKATKKAVGSMATLGKAQDFATAVERASDIPKRGFSEHKEKIQDVTPDLQAIWNKNPGATTIKDYSEAITQHIQDGEKALQASAGATQHDPTPVVSNLESRLDKVLDKYFTETRGKHGTQEDVDAAKEELKARVMQESGKDENGKPILRAPNLYEMENIRQGLNTDAAPQYSTTAKPTTNAYKAGAFEVAKLAREVIDEAYTDRGIDHVQERRAKEAKLIDVRDRLKMAEKKANDMGNGGLWDALTKKYSLATVVTAVALGHNPLAFGALAPYLAGDRIYQNVKNPNRNLARSRELADPNAKATELSFGPPKPGKAPAPGTPPATPPVTPPAAPVAPPTGPAPDTHPSQPNPHPQAAPEPLPAPHILAEHAARVAPAMMEEPPTNHALNAELATHFGEPLEHTSDDQPVTLADRIERVKNDAESMRRTGIDTAKTQTGKMLGATNEHEQLQADAVEQTQTKAREDAHKIAEELHKMLAQEAAEEKQQAAKDKQEAVKKQKAEKAKAEEEKKQFEENNKGTNVTTTPESFKSKQAEEKPLEYTDEEIPVPERYSYVKPRGTRIHEAGHIVGSHAAKLPPLDVISHLHPDGDPKGLAEARSDLSSIIDKDGNVNSAKVKSMLSDLTVRALSGGMAEEIYGGVPFEGNTTTGGDLAGIRSILRDHGEMSDGDIDRFIDMHKAKTRKLLTSEGMSDIFKRYGDKRIAGQDDRYHLNPANTARLVGELDALGGKNGKQQGNDGQAVLGSTKSGAGQDDARGEGKVRGGTQGRGVESLGDDSTKNQQKSLAAGLEEKSTGDHDIDAVIRNGGGIPAGMQDFGEFGKVHMFHDPETGSTLGFKPSEKITPQNVGKKLAKSREDFAAGEKANQKQTDMQKELAKTREQSRADRAHERSVDAEKAFNKGRSSDFTTKQAEGKKPGDIEIADESTGGTTERLLAKHGESKDPLANGFILPDGRRVAMGETDHADAVRQVTPKNERSPNTQQDMVDYLNRENVVRTRYRDSKGGKEVVFSVPTKGVSEDQVSQMRQSIGKMGRYGNAVMEIADSNGKSTQKEFVRPSDVDGMLREIGAHPEQKTDVDPYTKPMPFPKGVMEKIQASGSGMDEAAIHHHEFAHAVEGVLNGFQTKGILSHRHPALGKDMAAAAGFAQESVTADNAHTFLTRAMAGAAANEAMDGVSRDKNPGLVGDMNNAHRYLKALGVPEADHEAFINKAIDKAKELYTKPGVADIIREASKTREDNLPVEFHHSPNKVMSVTNRIKGILNGQESGNEAGVSGAGTGASGEAVAGREGQAAGKATPKSEKLKAFSPPKNSYEMEIQGPNGDHTVTIQALNRKAAFKAAQSQYSGEYSYHIKSETKPTVGEPFQTKQKSIPAERTTGNDDTDTAIKQGGAIPGGFEKGDPDADVPDMVHFHDPTTGSTLVVAADKVTPELIKQELSKSRGAYQLAAHEKEGGSTFSPTGQNLAGKNVYSVGEHPDRTQSVDKLTPEILEKFKNDNADLLSDFATSKGDRAVGTWKDPETGKSVLDVTHIHTDRAKAIAAGQAANQKAIYHLGGEGEIQTGGTGEGALSTKRKDDTADSDFNFGKNAEGTEDQQKGIISTAVPGGKNAIADPHTENVHVGMNSLTPETKVKIANKIRRMPGMRTPENITDPDKVISRYIGQFKSNLIDLYNQVPKETRDATAKWYESANKIGDRFASKYGKSTKQGAGVLAAMSPQKDWNMNVGLAERLTDIYHTHADEPLAPEAHAKAKEIGLSGMSAAIGGKTFSQLTEPLERAAFIRIWDETHNDRSFHNVDPATGDYTHVMTNNDGSNSKIAWGALNEIAKAVNILDDGSRENISRNLGHSHKVRNFYNNIVDPNNPGGHVTIDTHAVAAGHQRPLSGADPEVLDNFGRLSALKTGLKGTYAVHAEAYRQAAEELGLQPRQLQSIVWEQIRKTFPSELKGSEVHRAAIDNIWGEYKKGEITQKEAQTQVREYAKSANEQMAANREQPSASAAEPAQKDLGFPVLPSKFLNLKSPIGQHAPALESGLDKLSGK